MLAPTACLIDWLDNENLQARKLKQGVSCQRLGGCSAGGGGDSGGGGNTAGEMSKRIPPACRLSAARHIRFVTVLPEDKTTTTNK